MLLLKETLLQGNFCRTRHATLRTCKTDLIIRSARLTTLSTRSTLIPLAVLVCPLAVLVCSLVVSACPLVLVLSACLFVADQKKVVNSP